MITITRIAANIFLLLGCAAALAAGQPNLPASNNDAAAGHYLITLAAGASDVAAMKNEVATPPRKWG
jgi:hypothetical protein